MACNGYTNHGAFGFFVEYHGLVNKMVCNGVTGVAVNEVAEVPEVDHTVGFELWNATLKVEGYGDFPASVAANPGGDKEAELLFAAQ